jgi:hypothetical protein
MCSTASHHPSHPTHPPRRAHAPRPQYFTLRLEVCKATRGECEWCDLGDQSIDLAAYATRPDEVAAGFWEAELPDNLFFSRGASSMKVSSHGCPIQPASGAARGPP